jgi:AcrR family transcriptional regulator
MRSSGTGMDTETIDAEKAATRARPRRRADAERNIEAIITATLDLLRGGELPTMTEVAAAAGVGRVTLYSHFASREALLDAVIQRAIADTDHALAGLGLDDDPPDVALTRLVERTWRILDRYRGVRAAALVKLDPAALRDHHDPIVHHVERIIVRGRRSGVFRVDLAVQWLVAMFYATVHAAADEVSAGRLDPSRAAQVLVATLLSVMRG